MTTRSIDRVIDANLNRLREALRLLEDIQRYIYDNRELSYAFKELRHKLTPLFDSKRLESRDIVNDVSKESTESEMQRTNIKALIAANFSRATESARVLEETFKLVDTSASATAKEIRYRLYNLEILVHKGLESE
ncbi:MAG TPA: thiamine-phosphate pyrophosphorylase [Nitratifractor sp.]|nr:thiamine-phosphate pyrophosphorylase [Nitratifractor sp.]